MTAKEIRQKYLEFFKEKGHSVIPSAPLLPENDPTVLFTTAGMHPLVPYLLGEPHPEGKRLVSHQKCIRTGDIDEVGDNTHLTFFEMLGNWSLGDYFKEEAIKMSYEFLTDKKWLGIDPIKLAVSVFEGDDDAPRDEESAKIWKSLGIPEHKIAYLPKSENWWGPAGQTGPCGPDTEMFYWVGDGEPPKSSDPGNDEDNWVEIWNDVFMQYNKTEDGKFEPLEQTNVDTGMGLERVAAVLQGKKTVYDTELFQPIIEKINALTTIEAIDFTSERIIADHLRTATMMAGDGVKPSNVDQGYVMRRLMRRAIRHGKTLGIEENFTHVIAKKVIHLMSDVYPELKHEEEILKTFESEEEQFRKTFNHGSKEFEKRISIPVSEFKKANDDFMANPNIEKGNKLLKCLSKIKDDIYSSDKSFKEVWKLDNFKKPLSSKQDVLKLLDVATKRRPAISIARDWISGSKAFWLFETYGFPEESIADMAKEIGLTLDKDGFKRAYKVHQELSRAGAEEKFKGGLQDNSEATTALHTATHLLHAALKKVLGNHVKQKGSNITAERLRFDFSHPDKMTPEQIEQVEKYVNNAINSDAKINCKTMTVEDAKNEGAIGLFESKYGEKVKVYSMEDWSKEICGGPHVENLGKLGKFKIKKEQSSSAGIRRIKAVLINE